MRKKKALPPHRDATSLHAENRLKRRNEEIAKLDAQEEKSRSDFFKKRVREASKKRAPMTLRTKSYYRFAKDYPSAVDTEGFRENKPPKKKMSAGKKTALFISCIAVFIAAFIVSEVFIELSMRPPSQESSTDTAVPESSSVQALHLSFEQLQAGSAAIIGALRGSSCNTALFEFKTEYGYIPFDIGSFKGASADRVIAGAFDTVREINEAGFKTMAYISCFKDNVAASADSSIAVKELNRPESVLVDNNSAAWLNPFSQAARDYILSVAEAAIKGGFSFVVLDKLCFPSDFGLHAPYYEGSEAPENERSNVLVSFINSAMQLIGREKLIVMCDVYGFAAESTDAVNRYGGNLMSSDCLSFAVDARVDMQSLSAADTLGIYNYIDEMPSVFILDACTAAAKTAAKRGGTLCFACVKNDGTADLREIISYAGIENYILW